MVRLSLELIRRVTQACAVQKVVPKWVCDLSWNCKSSSWRLYTSALKETTHSPLELLSGDDRSRELSDPHPQVRCTYVVGEQEAAREKQRGEKQQTHRKRGLLAGITRVS